MAAQPISAQLADRLAKMILENGWYESETTQDSGFFKDLAATSKKEKITYLDIRR